MARYPAQIEVCSVQGCSGGPTVALLVPVVVRSDMFKRQVVVDWATPAGWTGDVCPIVDQTHDTARRAPPVVPLK